MIENSSMAERTEEIARNRSLVALRAPVDGLPVIDCVVVGQSVLDRTAVSHVPLVGALVVGNEPIYGFWHLRWWVRKLLDHRTATFGVKTSIGKGSRLTSRQGDSRTDSSGPSTLSYSRPLPCARRGLRHSRRTSQAYITTPPGDRGARRRSPYY